jgi:2-iminobutanoate/2-iminopropanoate deaminase
MGCSDAREEKPMQKTILLPPMLPDPSKNGYSQGVRVGQLLFLAGQTSIDRDYQIMHVNNFEAQVRQVFANMEAVLAEAGGTLANLVTMTVFITDMRFAREFLNLRREILQRDFPASALIGISHLANPAALIEIQAIAMLD